MPPESVDPLRSLIATDVVVVAGKGGVGKTTVTAVVARAAADLGRSVLAVELDGKPTLEELVPDLEVRHISAPDALDEYLRDHGFGRIAQRLNKTGVIDVIGTAAPGIDDVVVLGKIKQLQRTGQWDVIVVDGPAAGHAVTFLTSPAGLADAARGGPVKAQADEVLDLLHDPERFQAVLVAIPETTPVNELIETAYALEEDVGVRLGPVVANLVDAGVELPPPGGWKAAVAELEEHVAATLLGAAAFRSARRAMERAELERLGRDLPLPQVRIAARHVAGIGPDDVRAMAADLVAGEVAVGG